MTKHSQLVGGSNAGRLINCPGSFKATQALPPSADAPSEYAEEGTAMHKVMDMLMRARQENKPSFEASALAQSCIGDTFHDRVLTHEHVDTMILPALAALDELEETYGGGFSVVAVELQVQFPNLPGAFGTCDLVLTSDSHIIILDWKFGQGVPVQALYVYNESTADQTIVAEELNAQLMFYLAGAMKTKGRLFHARRQIVIAIVQPRTDEPLTHTVVTRKDVKMFREDLENAVVTAIERDPPIRKGEWCRWAPCKISCPLWTAPILGLAEAIGEKVVKPSDADRIARMVTPYGQYLARAKAFTDLLAPYLKEVNDQLHNYLEDGGVVPGWRLKDKAKNRQWIDEDTVHKELRALGFGTPEIFQTKLQTFTSVDATAKRLNVKIPDHLRVAPPSTETTIAPTGDPAPVVDRVLAREEFSVALRKLT